MVIFNDEKIAETKQELGKLLLIEGLISFWFAQKGMRSVIGSIVGKDIYAVAVGVSMFLFVMGNSLLIEAVKLYFAPYWECHKAGHGRSKLILGMFDSYEDYQAAIACKDERIALSILYGIYYFNILGKYAECLWFVQGLILTALTGNFYHLAFGGTMMVIVNIYHCSKQLSFDNTVKLTRVVKESEK